MSSKEKADAFLKISEQFKLGHLVTESFHPLTKQLSTIVKDDITEAFDILQEVDKKALEIMKTKKSELWALAQDIETTLKSGHKVFMCGCGATGRLSLVLETLYRQLKVRDQVFSFMAGGDYALIKSVESFEDRTDFGQRQLMELGFGEHDLLLASTEGGETPFVIGAVNKASLVSDRKPYFLYCNPDDVLKNIQRSVEVIQNPKIHKINLNVGPMAISGSTRMQASTVLMLAIGVGLLYEHKSEESFSEFYQKLLHDLTTTTYHKMARLTSLEAKLYLEKKHLSYITHPSLAISILTDTTERSPTFSLRAFENRLDAEKGHSLSYLFLPDAKISSEAWHELLWRAPRAVEWPELNGRIDLSKIHGFDISMQGFQDRSGQVPSVAFIISQSVEGVTFKCQDVEKVFNWGGDLFFNHLMVKMLLNAHSTLIMGILGRYEGNVMTWVRPSNNKLIDRAARYILQLLSAQNKTSSYEDIVHYIFEEMEFVNENEPVVLRVLKQFSTSTH